MNTDFYREKLLQMPQPRLQVRKRLVRERMRQE